MIEKTIIVPKTEEEMVAARAREEAEMMWCNPDAPEDEWVAHDKEYSGLKLDMYPQLLPWTCSRCGFSGHDREQL